MRVRPRAPQGVGRGGGGCLRRSGSSGCSRPGPGSGCRPSASTSTRCRTRSPAAPGSARPCGTRHLDSPARLEPAAPSTPRRILALDWTSSRPRCAPAGAESRVPGERARLDLPVLAPWRGRRRPRARRIRRLDARASLASCRSATATPTCPDYLDSVARFADAVIALDDGSTDATARPARQASARGEGALQPRRRQLRRLGRRRQPPAPARRRDRGRAPTGSSTSTPTSASTPTTPRRCGGSSTPAPTRRRPTASGSSACWRAARATTARSCGCIGSSPPAAAIACPARDCTRCPFRRPSHAIGGAARRSASSIWEGRRRAVASGATASTARPTPSTTTRTAYRHLLEQGRRVRTWQPASARSAGARGSAGVGRAARPGGARPRRAGGLRGGDLDQRRGDHRADGRVRGRPGLPRAGRGDRGHQRHRQDGGDRARALPGGDRGRAASPRASRSRAERRPGAGARRVRDVPGLARRAPARQPRGPPRGARAGP